MLEQRKITIQLNIIFDFTVIQTSQMQKLSKRVEIQRPRRIFHLTDQSSYPKCPVRAVSRLIRKKLEMP